MYKHFGNAPETLHSHTKYYVPSKGWEFERARGYKKMNPGSRLVIKKILDVDSPVCVLLGHRNGRELQPVGQNAFGLENCTSSAHLHGDQPFQQQRGGAEASDFRCLPILPQPAGAL